MALRNLRIAWAVLTALISAAVLAGAAPSTDGPAPNTGLLWGRVTDAEDHPIPDAVLAIHGEDLEEDLTVAGDESGWFSVTGLRPGLYSVRAGAAGFEASRRERIAVEPFGRVFLAFLLEKEGVLHGWTRLREDIFPAARTTFTSDQLERLPTGLSLNAVIENLDSVATSNRIDVGGMWDALPTLFGSRGASSWTQNVYLLNGLDITDPVSGGTPLVILDPRSLRTSYLANAAGPIQAAGPGAYFDLTPREGTSEFHGGLWGFYLDRTLASNNITPALRSEGLTESSTFNRLMDVNVHISGPIGSSPWTFFSSATIQSAGRDLADFEPVDESRLYSGLVHLVRRGEKRKFHFLWTGQNVVHPTYGAGRDIPPETTVRRTEWRNLVQWISETRPGPRSSSRFGLSVGLQNTGGDVQPEAESPLRLELFRRIPAGTAFDSSTEKKGRFSASYDGRSFFANVAGTHHLLEYGAQAHYAAAETTTSIPGNLRLHVFEGRPVEALIFASPFHHREEAAQFDLYVRETLILSSGLSLSLGFHGIGGYGRSGAGSIKRLNLSPRFAVQIPLSRRKTSALRATLGRYYAVFPLSHLTWGNPDAPGALAYAWNDGNGDGNWTPDESRGLLRREGPRYGGIDPDLRSPYTDELTLSFNHDLGRGWMMSLAGFLRESRDLIETINTGVPSSAYQPVTIFDAGDDRVPGSPDDLVFTVYDQRPETLGADFYLLSNPGRASRKSSYKGLDFVLFKRPTDRFLFYLGMTATQAYQTNGPGNTAGENDDGVIGTLYDTPNAGLNAEGRPRFDRAYTIRLGFSWDLPFGARIATVAKYYDGQPFARKIIVEGLTQGPFYIQAHSRGVARYEFNMTVDLRLEKRFRLPVGTLRLLADVFNLFNQHLATEENEWTRPEFPLREAIEIQSPRVLRLGFNLEF